jgi:UDP:flavonoid glycosyltransferase YjiC (YdhE family)
MPAALPAINAVCKRYGIDLVECAEYLEIGDNTFVPSIPEFDPLQDAPASLHYLGPILGNQLVPLPETGSSTPENSVPEIFFYPGRPHDGAGASGQVLLNVGLAALNALDATVTVATGGHDFVFPEYSGGRLAIVGWRVISADYKPDLILHHGGHGTCLTAISAGIPSAIVPTHAEREYNARNLAALGCGEFVATDKIDVKHVRRTVESAMQSPAYACACAQWSQTIAARRYEGADLAARIITRMIDGGS